MMPACMLDAVVSRVLGEICALESETRLRLRYEKFRHMGRAGVDFLEDGT
jgi:hypothetical protein